MGIKITDEVQEEYDNAVQDFHSGFSTAESNARSATYLSADGNAAEDALSSDVDENIDFTDAEQVEVLIDELNSVLSQIEEQKYNAEELAATLDYTLEGIKDAIDSLGGLLEILESIPQFEVGDKVTYLGYSAESTILAIHNAHAWIVADNNDSAPFTILVSALKQL